MPSISGRGTGWLPNTKPPARLFSSHPASGIPVSALPPRTFLTVPPSLDQDALGSCTWNAAAMCIAILTLMRLGYSYWASRLMGYREARILLGPQYVNQDSGAMPDDALAVATAGKVGPESLWPYIISKFTQQPPAAAYAAAIAHSLKSYSIQQGGSVAAAKQALVARFPINFGFSLRANANGMEIDRLGPDGMYPWDPNDGMTTEGHDVVLVGYDDDWQAFMAVNSWSQDWGVGIPGQDSRGRGCFKVPYAMWASSDVSDRSAVTDWS